jgi:hypothetical protein
MELTSLRAVQESLRKLEAIPQESQEAAFQLVEGYITYILHVANVSIPGGAGPPPITGTTHGALRAPTTGTLKCPNCSTSISAILR